MRRDEGRESTAEFLHTHVTRHVHAGTKRAANDHERERTVLVGNPNVGKSLIFNAMAGVYVNVSNYPGTTVEIEQGSFGDREVFDTPGVYGISAFTEDEKVTRDSVLAADVVLNVVDAVHLERDLFLTLQLIDMGKRVSVLLNMMDEAAKQEIRLDVRRLSESLGVPVYPMSAVRSEGFDQLEPAVCYARVGNQDHDLHQRLHEMLQLTGSEAEALLILEGDEATAAQHGVPAGMDRERVYVDRRNRVNTIVNDVLTEAPHATRLSTLLGRWALNLWTGIPMILVALYGIYLLVGKLVAQDVVGFTEKSLGHGLWEPWIRAQVAAFLNPASWVGSILVGEFGVLTMTVTYLVFLLLPLVIAFYFALALLEDSGYLPRIATLVDRSLSALGLNGSAVIPLILGFGCVTMATVSTRVLGSQRERTILTTILQFAVPCSAQLAVVAALLAGAGFGAMIIYAVTIFAVFVATGTLLHAFLPGTATPLLIDLPPLRLPRLDNLFRKTMYRTYAFMKEASGWFFVGALAVGLMQMSGLISMWENLVAPFTTGWLKLPRGASTAFVMGVVRRDFGAAGLYQMSLTPHQVVVALVTITLFVPCIASFIVMLKERGTKQALIVWTGTWIAAFVVGGALAQTLSLFN